MKTGACNVAGSWTFLTNHGHVLVSIAQNPHCRARDLAERVGITERTVRRIIAELNEAGYLTFDRQGRRNRYAVHAELQMRHQVEGDCLVSDLLDTVMHPGTPSY